jgi:hypothetical protein
MPLHWPRSHLTCAAIVIGKPNAMSTKKIAMAITNAAGAPRAKKSANNPNNVAHANKKLHHIQTGMS